VRTIFHCLRLVCLIVLGLAWTTTASFAVVDVQSPAIRGVSIGYDQAYASLNGYDAAPLRAWEDENQSALPDARASFGLDPGFIAAKTTPTSTAIVPYYPPANGFAGATTRQFLMPGQTIDRFGGSGASRFFSPTGTSEAARALPPGTAGQPLRTFEVVKPFEVDSGTVAPWFSQPGGGTQFRTPVPLETLLKRGILREQ